MEQVWFITAETGTDLIVSFAVRKLDYPEEIESLTLLRTPKYEHLLPPEERGVSVSFERLADPEEFGRKDLLVAARYDREGETVHLTTQEHSFDLDVSKVDAGELDDMCKVMRRMNRGAAFLLTGF